MSLEQSILQSQSTEEDWSSTPAPASSLPEQLEARLLETAGKSTEYGVLLALDRTKTPLIRHTLCDIGLAHARLGRWGRLRRPSLIRGKHEKRRKKKKLRAMSAYRF